MHVYKIIIIKLGGFGDVLRTTVLLHGLKRKYPESDITWVTDAAALDLLNNNPYIDKCLDYSEDNEERLKKCVFDILICLDKEKEATSLAVELKAISKMGFGINEQGHICPLNKESEYAYMLGISDELKFKLNRKSYQEIIYEMCLLDYERDRYILNLKDAEIDCIRNKLMGLGIAESDFVIGLNIGAGDKFANKSLSYENWAVLINTLVKKTDGKILLLGGKKEESINEKLRLMFRNKVYSLGCNNSLREFASIITHCSAVVSGDTLAMHIAIALGKYTIALFGPTCHQEIDLCDNGTKIISGITCGPCYKKRCDKKYNCMSVISPESIFKEIILFKNRIYVSYCDNLS